MRYVRQSDFYESIDEWIYENASLVEEKSLDESLEMFRAILITHYQLSEREMSYIPNDINELKDGLSTDRFFIMDDDVLRTFEEIIGTQFSVSSIEVDDGDGDGDLNSARSPSQRQVDELFPLVIDGDRIRLAIPNQSPSDLEILDQLRPEIIGLIQKRLTHYEQSPNRPQASHFSPGLEGYLELLRRPLNEIPWVLLWSRGRRIIGDFDAAVDELARDKSEWDTFEPAEKSELDTIIDIHGQLMSLTREGNLAVARAREQESSPEQERENSKLIQEFVEAIGRQGNLTSTQTQKVMEEVANGEITGNYGKRAMVMKYAVVTSVAALMFGTPAAVVGVATYALAGTTAGAVGAGLTLLGTDRVVNLIAGESIKKAKLFEEVREDGTRRVNAITDAAVQKVGTMSANLNAAITHFRGSAHRLIDRVADIRPEFRWMKTRDVLDNEAGKPVEVDLIDAQQYVAAQDYGELPLVRDPNNREVWIHRFNDIASPESDSFFFAIKTEFSGQQLEAKIVRDSLNVIDASLLREKNVSENGLRAVRLQHVKRPAQLPKLDEQGYQFYQVDKNSSANIFDWDQICRSKLLALYSTHGFSDIEVRQFFIRKLP